MGEQASLESDAPSAPAAKPAAVAASHLAAALRTRLTTRPGEWHIEEELTLNGRRLDLVAFNLWSARGFRVVGYELKVSRGDWLRELADHTKAEEWQAVVDDFYLVTPPKLVRPDELPRDWGHLELCGSRLMTRAYPAKRAATTTLPREMVARFLGRAGENLRREEWSLRTSIREELRREFAAKAADGSHAAELTRLTQQLEAERRRNEDLLAALGCSRYEDAKALRIARALAEVQASEPEFLLQNVRRLAEGYTRRAALLTEAVKDADAGRKEGV